MHTPEPAELPVLYTFRRCPYAIRARMAILQAGQTVEWREVLLRDKPAEMLRISPKGTVPVLLLPSGDVLDESIDIMEWALALNDPEHWLRQDLAAQTQRLLETNDGPFKAHLDHYKYHERHPEHPQSYYRRQGEVFLQQLEQLLDGRAFLLDDVMSFADVAIFPFIRQFAMVDRNWFDQAPFPNLRNWLLGLMQAPTFIRVMGKQTFWQAGQQAVTFP